MHRTRGVGMVALALLLLGAPGRADGALGPSEVALRLLAGSPQEVAEALRDYETLDAAARERVRDLLADAGRHPARFADHVIDRALQAHGDRRERLLGVLGSLGRPALQRMLERLPGAPARLFASEPSPSEGTPSERDATRLLAQDGRPVIQIECRLLEGRPERLTEILGAARPTSESPVVKIDEALAAKLLEHAGKDLRVLHAPRLTTFDREPANVTVTHEVSYVKDYEPKRDADGNMALDPVVDVVQEGLILDLEPSVEGTTIELTLKATLADLARPIAEFPFSYEGESARIQVPELQVSRVAASPRLADGGYVLVGGFRSTDENERVLLLKVERLELTPR